MNIIHHINELKDINYMFISIGLEKSFDKIEHAFMIQVLQTVILKGTYFKITSIYDKYTANFILN